MNRTEISLSYKLVDFPLQLVSLTAKVCSRDKGQQHFFQFYKKNCIAIAHAGLHTYENIHFSKYLKIYIKRKRILNISSLKIDNLKSETEGNII